MTGHVVLIGVGNPWRGDDGVGRAVVDAAAQQLSDVEVVRSDGEPARLIDAWTGAGLAVVVDAVRGGAAPGTVQVWDGDPGAARSVGATGSHALGIGEAIGLALVLGRLPARLAVVGVHIEGASHGDGLSPLVAAAVDEAVARVLELVQAGSRATSSAVE